MKMTWKLFSLAILTTIFSYSCSNGNTSPTFVYKKAVGNGVAAKVGDISITEAELVKGIESELYEADVKKFDIKFNKLQGIILEKLMANDPNKKGLSNDEYLNKYIISKINISDKAVKDFIKEKNIPAQHVNDQLKTRIVSFLKEGEKKKAIDEWIAKKTKGSSIEVFFKKPRRPSFDVKVGDSPFMGDKNAKVTIVEFSDFQCPFCSKATTILKQVKAKYGNKVKVVFKQYPLPFHNQAKVAAVASLCANDQGVKYFWKMHDAMFANQSKLSPSDLKAAAKNLGMDTKKFDACLDSNKHMARVEAEIKEGQAVGVKSTPTFFVNGQIISGAHPIETFTEIIDSELNM